MFDKSLDSEKFLKFIIRKTLNIGIYPHHSECFPLHIGNFPLRNDFNSLRIDIESPAIQSNLLDFE